MKPLLLLLMLLTACSVPQGNYLDPYIEEIATWQVREGKNCIHQTGIIDMELANQIRADVFSEIEYESSKSSYVLPTSAEVEADGEAVCIGFAVEIYHRLREAGFPDDQIGIMRSINHAVAFVDDGEYRLLTTYRIETLESYWWFKPIIAFNLFGAWVP